MCLFNDKAVEFPKSIKRRCSLYFFIFQNIHTHIHKHLLPSSTFNGCTQPLRTIHTQATCFHSKAHTHTHTSPSSDTVRQALQRVHPLYQLQPCRSLILHVRKTLAPQILLTTSSASVWFIGRPRPWHQGKRVHLSLSTDCLKLSLYP